MTEVIAVTFIGEAVSVSLSVHCLFRGVSGGTGSLGWDLSGRHLLQELSSDPFRELVRVQSSVTECNILVNVSLMN